MDKTIIKFHIASTLVYEDILRIDFKVFRLPKDISLSNRYNIEQYILKEYFRKHENIFHVNQEEANLLATNLLSINRRCIVSDKRFTSVNKWLESNGYDIHLVDYSAIGKLGGLLRCSTLPLERQLV